MEHISPTKKTGIAIFVLVVVLVLTSILVGRSHMNRAMAPQVSDTQMIQDASANIPPLSEKKDTASLEQDLNATDFTDIDQQLGS